jgi:GNAT superfamily N-acetyltransferase
MRERIREIAPKDYAPAAELFAGVYPERAREAEGWARSDVEAPGQRWVVVGEGGEIAGYASYWRVRGDRCRMDLVVRPDRRRQGLGSALLAAVVERATAAGAVTLQARADAAWGDSLRFLERRGFAETMRMYWTQIDPRDADLSLAAGPEARIAERGIRVTTLRDEEPRDPHCWERLADLLYAAREGWPDPDPGGPESPPPSAAESRAFFGMEGLVPEALFIAEHGGAYVGYSGIAVRPSAPGVAWPAGTVVRPGYRGLGVATALKVRVLAYARAHGLTTMHSSSGNPTLLHINRKLGFHLVWCEVRLVRQLGTETLGAHG